MRPNALDATVDMNITFLPFINISLCVLTAASVPELASNGTSVVMVTAGDADGSRLSFSIVSPPAPPFSINSATGLVTVQGRLDFESMDR